MDCSFCYSVYYHSQINLDVIVDKRRCSGVVLGSRRVKKWCRHCVRLPNSSATWIYYILSISLLRYDYLLPTKKQIMKTSVTTQKAICFSTSNDVAAMHMLMHRQHFEVWIHELIFSIATVSSPPDVFIASKNLSTSNRLRNLYALSGLYQKKSALGLPSLDCEPRGLCLTTQPGGNPSAGLGDAILSHS